MGLEEIYILQNNSNIALIRELKVGWVVICLLNLNIINGVH